MLDLHITWPEGDARFTPSDSPVQVGRSSDAAVPLTQGSVSRRHLELTWDGVHWQVRDHSTHGTYEPAGMRRPSTWTLDGDTSLRLGGTEGVGVHIRVLPGATPAPVPGGGEPVAVGRLMGSGTVDHGEEAAKSASGSVGGALPEPSPAGATAAAGSLFAEQPGAHRLLDDSAPEAPPPAPPEPVASRSLLEPEAAPVPGATGGHSAIQLDPNATIIGDSTLRLSVEGQDYSFLPGAEVTVGRDPACLVHLDERHSLVSRRHLRLSHRDDSWWIEDHSSKGTWIDHRRIKGPYKVEGSFLANLGDDDAGTPMRIITAGEHRLPRNTSPLLIAALTTAILIPLLLLAIVLTRGDDQPDFASAKKSTVALFGLEGGQGSGFFVSDKLILTNQHVAALSPQLLVGVSRTADEPAQIEYATELVGNHPFLDIAVLRVSNKASISSTGPEISPDPVGDIDLPAAPIGDSSALTIGDSVFSTGFPGRLSITSTDNMGALRLPAVVATSGEVANFGIWPGCSNPDMETFIPADSPPGVGCAADGDVDRGVLLSTFESGQGASGSPVFNHNEVVGVVYAGAPDETNASLDIATAAFADWLDEIVAANS